MKQFGVDSVGVFGLALVAWGVRCIYEPAAFIVVGALLTAWAVLVSRR